MNRLAPAVLAAVVVVTGFAPVQSVQARERCYDVEVQRKKPVKDDNRIAGTAIGAVAGGLLGNQVGGGDGKKAATVVGALGGAYAGNRIQKNNQRKSTETVIERRCERY